MDCLRGERISREAQLTLSLCLITWNKLTRQKKINLELALKEEMLESPRDAEIAMLKIAESLDSLGFKRAAGIMADISKQSSVDALKAIFMLDKQGLLSSYDPSDVSELINSARSNMQILPTELADLIHKLAGQIKEGATVYLPWDNYGQMIGRVERSDSFGALEIFGGNVDVADLLRIESAKQKPALMAISDPVASPSYVDSGKLKIFDCVIATPPIGMRVELNAFSRDAFDRKFERTNSYAVLAILHALAQTNGRAVVLVSNSVLFASGGDRVLREYLLKEGLIESIVSLPSSLLTGMQVGLSILVMNKSGGSESVNFLKTIRMINCETDDFFVKETRTKNRLVHLDQIVGMSLRGLESHAMREVTLDEVAANDFNLMPSRYVKDAASDKVQQTLANYPCHDLEKIADVIRPLPASEPANPIDAWEIGAAELTSSGYLDKPSRAVKVQNIDKRDIDQFVRPLDVILAIKGSVGKVAIAPPDTPPPGPGGWVIGQSMIILRSNSPTVSPYALVVFLRSDVGQELLGEITTGATIRFLQVKEIRRLMIPAPSPSENGQINSLFNKQVELIELIKKMQAEVAAQKHLPWTLKS